MPPYTNGDLYRWPNHLPRTDHLYVVTQEPQTGGAVTTVTIDLDTPAAVVDRFSHLYDQPYSVGDLRAGRKGLWLLSGGCLITDQDDRIAVGLRDGNAADPFAVTNIAAGRCDQLLEKHCQEELESEFILCVQARPRGRRRNPVWRQVNFGPGTLLLCSLGKPCVSKQVSRVMEAIYMSGGMCASPPIGHASLQSVLAGTIVVEWRSADVIQREELSGYVWTDEANRTVEFRRGIKINLSGWAESCIFFGEGTGYAQWVTADDIRRLADFGTLTGRCLITPFLAHL